MQKNFLFYKFSLVDYQLVVVVKMKYKYVKYLIAYNF